MKPRTAKNSIRQTLFGYCVAACAVLAALSVVWLIQLRWQGSASVSLFLTAVILSAWIGGPKPALLAAALSLLSFDYYLTFLARPSVVAPIQAIRLFALAAVGGYVIWVTISERVAAEAQRSAHEEVIRNNEALRAEMAQNKRTELELRQSEEKFRALSENAPMPILIYQGDKICYANPAASHVSGYSTEELYDMSFRDLAQADFRDLVRQRGLARQRGEFAPPRYELKIVTKSGEERWIDLTDGQFEFQGMPAVVGVVFDITERKRTEEALRENRELLNQVLATLPVGVSVTNQVGDIVLVNETSHHIWGDVIISGARRWVQSKGFWHRTGVRIEPEEWASARALAHGHTTLNEPVDIETYDGGQRTIQNSAAPIRNAEGLIVGAVIVNEDVTERMRAELGVCPSNRSAKLLTAKFSRISRHGEDLS